MLDEPTTTSTADRVAGEDLTTFGRGGSYRDKPRPYLLDRLATGSSAHTGAAKITGQLLGVPRAARAAGVTQARAYDATAGGHREARRSSSAGSAPGAGAGAKGREKRSTAADRTA